LVSTVELTNNNSIQFNSRFTYTASSFTLKKEITENTVKMKSIFTTTLLVATASLSSAFAPISSSSSSSCTATTTQLNGSIQFVRGLEEKVIPNVKLTRATDGSSGIATFLFDNPNVFDASTAAEGDVTGMFMVDEEGEISTTDVNARFSNGKPQAIESTYVMTSPEQWDRFMRFMESYGEANGLGFKAAA
jgi:photosystem II protein